MKEHGRLAAFELAAAVVLLALLAWPAPSRQAESAGSGSLALVGSSEKICQLTGDVDWETGRPTAARTLTNFGLDAVDLGYPVDDGKKLVLLFGDSWPPPHGGGAAGTIPPDDAVGVTVRTRAPAADSGCLDLEINDRSQAKKVFAPATVVGAMAVKQGFFNVPSGGVSVGGNLFAFFWTNHCAGSDRLRPLAGNPLARPQPTAACPENDGQNSIGSAVLGASSDGGRTFAHVVPMPAGLVYSTAVNTQLENGLPADQRLGVFVFGVPRYRASSPYLAYAPAGTLSDPATWRFFAGLGTGGTPTWVKIDAWGRTGTPEWKPPVGAEVIAPITDAERCIGEFSVTWNGPLDAWLMLYNCPGGIEARIAPAPWGPWSPPTNILGATDDVACRLVMTPDGCGQRRDYWPQSHVNGKFVAGGFYAPYVVNRYTTAGAGNNRTGRTATIYWLVSSWNPYEVTVMRTTLQRTLN